MSDDKLRSILELWVEYLKRSDKYKAYCELIRQGTTFQDNDSAMFINYSLFGDVYTQSLENILSSVNDWNSFFTPIYDYSEHISNDIDLCINHFEKTYNRKPTIEEIKIFLIEIMRDSSKLYLKIDITDVTAEEITEAFSQRLIITNKETLQQKGRKKPFLYPSTRIRLDELKRYLRVYDLSRQGLKMKDIIKELNPSSDNTDVDVQRSFYRDLENAKNIIQNVEKGIFPGNYSN